MINWQELFDSYRLDKEALQLFQPKGNITLIEDEAELNEVQEWIQHMGVGMDILPLLKNGESDYIGIFTGDILYGKVLCLTHDDPEFVPRYRNLHSAIEHIAGNDLAFDWHELNENAWDYPDKQKQLNSEDEKILTECRKRIEENDFPSETNRELIVVTAMYLTPVSQLETIMPFLEDNNTYISNKALWLLGEYHKYEPAKDKISELLKDSSEDIRQKYYNGELPKKSFWQKLLGK